LRGPEAERLLRQGENLFVIGMTGLTVSLCLITFYLSALHEMQVSFTFQTAMVDVAALGALLMAMQERTWMARALSWAPLRALGRISYGFYLFHDIPHNFYIRAVSLASARLPFEINDEAAVAVLAFICTVTMAALSYRFLERPFLKLKNKWGVADVRAARKEEALARV
jgi:peptidoglycan/LPS O-acetylase OafA/YrhL